MGSGGECFNFIECAIGLTCKGVQFSGDAPVRGTCEEPSGLGEACLGDSDCSSRECGSEGTCVEEEVCEVP